MFAQNSKSKSDVLIKTESEKADAVICVLFDTKKACNFFVMRRQIADSRESRLRVTGNFLRRIRTDVD